MIMEKVSNYINENQINKREIADKMHISERKLERILRTSDNIIQSCTYCRIVMALGVSADKFFEE